MMCETLTCCVSCATFILASHMAETVVSVRHRRRMSWGGDERLCELSLRLGVKLMVTKL